MKDKIATLLKAFSKKLPLLGICAGIVGMSYWFLIEHYKFSFVSINSDLVYRLESKLFDMKFKFRGPKKATGKVGILAIDEKSLELFGTYPISRKYYARAFDNLKKLGVTWIGFDTIYIEKQKTNLEEVFPQISKVRKIRNARARNRSIRNLGKWLDESPADTIFARGIKSFQNIVLGFFYFSSQDEVHWNLGKDKTKYWTGLETMLSSALEYDIPEGRTLNDYYNIKKAFGLRSNIPIVANSSEHFAFFSNDADDDAINRWVTLVANVNGNLMPSLALKTVAEHLNSDVFVFLNDIGVEAITLVNRDDDEKVVDLPVDANGRGRILVNSRGPSRAFHHFSLADAYRNSFSPKEKQALKGASLLLGATATGTNDLRPNVFDAAIDGVENHAAVMDNIVAGDYYKRPESIFKIELWTILGVGLLFSPLMIWGRSVTSGLAVVLFLSGFWYFDWKFWFTQGTWVYMGIPSLEIIGMFICTTLFKYATEEREKRKVKGAFQHYLSPDVIDQMLDDPDAMALGGVRKDCTVFFSDVRSFTTISESLTPEKLCEFMNEYFTPMEAIILESQGTLDKYIGDAIMAFWGAPLNLPDHPARAAKASVDMMFALDKLQHDLPARGFPKPDIGIGLNSGSMSVGNMGSANRFSYTAMGDEVNLGARLEGLTKDYKIKILISESTAQRLPKEHFFYRDLDDIRVKGKTEPKKVFELMRPDALPNADHIRNLIGSFELGRIAYREQNWDAAEKHFMECMTIRPDDGPTELYLKRVKSYKENPPAQDWDGVYTFTHK